MIIIPLLLYVVSRKLFYYSLLIVYPIIGQMISAEIEVLGLTLNPSMLFGLIILALTALDFILQPTRYPLMDFAILFFVAYAMLTSMMSPVRFISLSWSLKIATWMLMLSVSTRIYDSEQDLTHFHIVVCIGVIIIICSFVFSRLGFYGRSLTYETGVKLYGGGFKSGKALAYYLAVAVPVLYGMFLDKRNAGRPFALALMLASLLVILMTFVRSPVIALLVGWLIYYFISAKYGGKSMVKTLGTIAVIAVIVTIIFLALGESQYTSRWREMGDKYSEGNVEKLGSGRVGGLIGFYEYYFQKASMFRKIFGSGLGSSSVYLGTNILIHNDYAELLVGCGVIGFSAYMLILYLLLHNLLKLLKMARAPDLKRHLFMAIFNFVVVLFFHMTNISSGVLVLSVWALHIGATIGVAHRALNQNVSSYTLPTETGGDSQRKNDPSIHIL